MAELLIGCGNSRKKVIRPPGTEADWTDLVTLDISPESDADVIHDLEVLPLPFEDNSFDEIQALEVLEHTGSQGDFRFFFAQFNEFHRILKDGGYFCGSVPRVDSIWAWGDPGHKRVLPPTVFNFLVERYYEQLGKTPCADYRPWIKGFWEALPSEQDEDRFYFVLRKK